MKQVLKLALLLTSACAFSDSSFASNDLQEQISGIVGKAGSALPSVAPQDILKELENNLGELKTLKSLAKKQTNNNNVSVNNNDNVDSNLIGSIVKVANGLNKVNSSINSNEQLKASVGKIGVSASNNTSVHAKGMLGLPDITTIASLASTLSSLTNNGQLIGDAQTVYAAAKTGINLLNTLKSSLPSNNAKIPAVPAHNSPVKKRDL